MTATLDRATLTTPPLPRAMVADIYARCGWEPYELQSEVVRRRARNRIVAAGRRAGKSQVGGYLLVPEAFRAHAELDTLRRGRARREYWIVGPEYSDSEKEFRVLWSGLEALGFPFDHPGSYNNPESGEMQISLFNRRFIVTAKSAKYPGTLVGEGLSGVVFSEAAKLKWSVWNKYIRPTLADFLGWSFFSSTPEGHNWFYDLWMMGQDPDMPGWASWRAPSWINPYVFRDGCNAKVLDGALRAKEKGSAALRAWIALHPIKDTERGPAPVGIDPEIWSMLLEMSLEMFNQEVAALFTEFVGRVFKNFDEETHVSSQEFRNDWITFAAADYGFTNPFVWLLIQVDPHGERIHVVDEYYEPGKTTREACDDIRVKGLAPSSLRMFYPDPAEPDRTREIEQTLLVRAYGHGSIELKDRIEWIRRLLRPFPEHLDLSHPESAPRLTIHRRCVNLIHEMAVWKYPETAEQARERGRHAPELPEKKNDHAPEALGRFLSGYYGSPWAGGSQARQSRVRVRR